MTSEHLLSKVQLAVWVGLVGHGAPGEIHHVERDEAGLEQARVGQVFLYLGQDRGHTQHHAQQHVEGDEELVELALSHHGAGVVAVADDDGDQGEDVEEAGGCQQSVEPVGVVRVLVLVGPTLSPAVSKVYDENKLDDDEEKSSDHPEIHPRWAEIAVRNEECSYPADYDDEVFESPET